MLHSDRFSNVFNYNLFTLLCYYLFEKQQDIEIYKTTRILYFKFYIDEKNIHIFNRNGITGSL